MTDLTHLIIIIFVVAPLVVAWNYISIKDVYRDRRR
jgi:hypothetical protein